MDRTATYVLGLGNVLMGDDGFGPAVVRAFDEQYAVDGDVAVIDLGTPGLDLSPWLADAEHIVLVDTVRSDRPAGSLRVYDKDEILRYQPVARTSPHDPGVKEALLTLEFAGRAPRAVTLVGVVPERSDMGLELSGPVRAAVPAAIAAIVSALEASGATVQARRDPVARDPWWAAPAAAR